MSEKSEQLKARTEASAIAVVKFCDTMPNSMAGRRIAEQLLDAGTSVAANYRAVCRAYTNPLFISKLAIVDEEADESEFWFRLIRQAGLRDNVTAKDLEQEAHERACIFSVSLRTARNNARKRREAKRRNVHHLSPSASVSAFSTDDSASSRLLSFTAASACVRKRRAES